MKVLYKIGFKDLKQRETKHINNRLKRIENYQTLLSEKFITCFVVDKEHINGCEIHCINENGLIYIYNYKSKKFITVLHPRPSQLKRYYRLLRIEIPKHIKRLARECYKRNEKYNLNNA